MAENPAKIFRLDGRGAIEEGGKADLAAVDMKREHVIDAARFHSKAKFSPFDGKRVRDKT
jgi:dihydroorotase